ncbi:MAG: pyridoxal phosphate-dependent aminotransferase [Muribaculaceae bacterium]|nr:pyridoxal phosphate-dependent aminotransferase [Muribaculaceae bacterium]
MFPIDKKTLDETIKKLEIVDVTTATIRQICSLSDALEEVAGEPFIHLEIGNPGLPANQIGVEAECAALQDGIANKYPAINGIPQLKKAGSRFIKAFLDVDVPAQGIVPTVGSMQGCFTMMLLLKQRMPEKDTMLFINPGFPAQRNQAKVLGLNIASFDIYEYRGKKLEAKLEEMMKAGNITGLIYSNPNNPAWTNLTEEELEIIGRMATKYDVIVLEDLAYLGMDFRSDLGQPFQAPYVPTVAKYTDNYVLMISASKIFSYAGQRIALVCMSDKVYHRHYQYLMDFYEMPSFGDAYIFGVLYVSSSGTAHSAQYALAAMMDAACDGKLNFVKDSREYGRRAGIVKKMLLDNGFHIVYAIDGDRPISDGFFFTAGYKDMTSEELQIELMRYGVSSISLPSTGSEQNGVRVCVSMISDDESFARLNERLKAFNNDH